MGLDQLGPTIPKTDRLAIGDIMSSTSKSGHRHSIANRVAMSVGKRKPKVTLPTLTKARAMTDLYNLRESNEPGTWIITKFDKYLNVQSNYLCSHNECACPRGHAPTCRHRKMLHLFKNAKHIGDGWFLDFDTRQWIEPVLDDIDGPSAHSPSMSAPVEEQEVAVLPQPSPAPVVAPTVPPASTGVPSPRKHYVRPL